MSYLGSAASCGPYYPAPPNNTTPAVAHPAFRPELERLLAEIKKHGLPFEIRAINRSLDAQCHAICRGASKLTYPESSAHSLGLAADFRLLPGYRGPTNSEYHTGYDRDTGKTTDEIAKQSWVSLGNLIKTKFPKLKWGGDFGKKSGQPFGWDPFHVELRDYRDFVPTVKKWKCAQVNGRATAVPISTAAEQAKASAEAAIEEKPGKVLSLPVLLAGAAAAYWLWKRSKRRR